MEQNKLKSEGGTKWFDRDFNFNINQEQFAGTLDRLKAAPGNYEKTASGIPESYLIFKPDGKWSIKEHLGHLLLLEPLWRKRFQEIKENKPEMSPADLNNASTDEAGFNEYPLNDLLDGFYRERMEITRYLDTLKPADFNNSSIHPRFKKSMRIMDLMYFVAEHDDHHLNTIHKIIYKQKNF